MQNKALEKQMGMFRIERLFELALQRAMGSNPEDARLSKRYVSIALEISRHYKIKLPDSVGNRICKGCGSVLVPGRSCRVRVSGGFVAYTCTHCGTTKRVFVKAT